ncbi:MAG: hypothetical protein A2020_04755 [Lentisphaerae bacterium GWF2_45_14]|nr:MAG: hypothetical protein A2020_04755 [Lentisphaerae bacterium GWF2_45_14]
MIKCKCSLGLDMARPFLHNSCPHTDLDYIIKFFSFNEAAYKIAVSDASGIWNLPQVWYLLAT